MVLERTQRSLLRPKALCNPFRRGSPTERAADESNYFFQNEPPRDSRRLHYLRGWSHEQIDEVFAGGPERAVRLVFEHQGEYESQWAAIGSIASKIGCTAETLRKWVRQAERDQGNVVVCPRRIVIGSRIWNARIVAEAGQRDPAQSVGFFRPGGARPPTEVMVSFIDAHRVRGRVDLQAVANRPIAVLRTQGAVSGPGRLPPRLRRDVEVGMRFGGFTSRISTFTARARCGGNCIVNKCRGTLYGRASDALPGLQGCGSRTKCRTTVSGHRAARALGMTSLPRPCAWGEAIKTAIVASGGPDTFQLASDATTIIFRCGRRNGAHRPRGSTRRFRRRSGPGAGLHCGPRRPFGQISGRDRRRPEGRRKPPAHLRLFGACVSRRALSGAGRGAAPVSAHCNDGCKGAESPLRDQRPTCAQASAVARGWGLKQLADRLGELSQATS